MALHGDTGPYVLYVYARINSLLEKARPLIPNRASRDELEDEADEAMDKAIAHDQSQESKLESQGKK